MRHFTIDEFESPDLKGSGMFMDKTHLSMIDEARGIAGVPFIVNSGYRTKKHNRKVYKDLGLPVNEDSSHPKGFASDIKCTNSVSRDKILKGLRKAGFTRIGIAKTFIHADNDINKAPNVTWIY